MKQIRALVFALASAWAAGAGYAYITRPYADELAVLRARAAVIESIEDRVITMTPAERRTFDELFKRNVARAMTAELISGLNPGQPA